MICRTIIAEDEPPARQRLLDLVEQVEWIECVGTASDGPSAVRLINRLEPDLAFLDIRMPGASGVDVVKSAEHTPYVVFTTAYDRYAVTAFELNAVDYLLKPFSEGRFRDTIGRVHDVIVSGRSAIESNQRARDALERSASPRRLFVRSRGKIVPLPVEEIVRLEAQDDYVMIHSKSGQHLVHVRLRDLADRLDAARFVRIHRSHVANIDLIKTLEPYDGHRMLVELDDGSSIVASRTGTKLLRALVL